MDTCPDPSSLCKGSGSETRKTMYKSQWVYTYSSIASIIVPLCHSIITQGFCIILCLVLCCKTLICIWQWHHPITCNPPLCAFSLSVTSLNPNVVLCSWPALLSRRNRPEQLGRGSSLSDLKIILLTPHTVFNRTPHIKRPPPKDPPITQKSYVHV